MKRLLIYTVIVMATLMAVYFLWQFRGVLILFLFSLVVSAAIRPPIASLVQMGLPRPAAVLFVYLAGLILLIAAILLVGGSLFDELQSLTDSLAASYELAYSQWTDGNTFQQTITTRLPAPEVLYDILTGPENGSLGEHVLGLTRGLLTFAAGVFVVLALSAYWTIDQYRFERLWFSILPVKYRSLARDSWRSTMESVGTYLRGALVQSVIAVVVLSLSYRLLGLDFPITLALMGAVFWLIPIVGALLAIPPVFLAGLSDHLGIALASVFLTLTLLWLLEIVLEKRFFSRRRYSTILTVLLMLMLVEDLGILGLVIAPPMAAAIQSFSSYWLNPVNRRSSKKPAEQILWLQERVRVMRGTLSENGVANLPETMNLVDRLSELIDRAGQILPAEQEADNNFQVPPTGV